MIYLSSHLVVDSCELGNDVKYFISVTSGEQAQTQLRYTVTASLIPSFYPLPVNVPTSIQLVATQRQYHTFTVEWVSSSASSMALVGDEPQALPGQWAEVVISNIRGGAVAALLATYDFSLSPDCCFNDATRRFGPGPTLTLQLHPACESMVYTLMVEAKNEDITEPQTKYVVTVRYYSTPNVLAVSPEQVLTDQTVASFGYTFYALDASFPDFAQVLVHVTDIRGGSVEVLMANDAPASYSSCLVRVHCSLRAAPECIADALPCFGVRYVSVFGHSDTADPVQYTIKFEAVEPDALETGVEVKDQSVSFLVPHRYSFKIEEQLDNSKAPTLQVTVRDLPPGVLINVKIAEERCGLDLFSTQCSGDTPGECTYFLPACQFQAFDTEVYWLTISATTEDAPDAPAITYSIEADVTYLRPKPPTVLTPGDQTTTFSITPLSWLQFATAEIEQVAGAFQTLAISSDASDPSDAQLQLYVSTVNKYGGPSNGRTCYEFECLGTDCEVALDSCCLKAGATYYIAVYNPSTEDTVSFSLWYTLEVVAIENKVELPLSETNVVVQSNDAFLYTFVLSEDVLSLPGGSLMVSVTAESDTQSVDVYLQQNGPAGNPDGPVCGAAYFAHDTAAPTYVFQAFRSCGRLLPTAYTIGIENSLEYEVSFSVSASFAEPAELKLGSANQFTTTPTSAPLVLQHSLSLESTVVAPFSKLTLVVTGSADSTAPMTAYINYLEPAGADDNTGCIGNLAQCTVPAASDGDDTPSCTLTIELCYSGATGSFFVGLQGATAPYTITPSVSSEAPLTPLSPGKTLQLKVPEVVLQTATNGVSLKKTSYFLLELSAANAAEFTVSWGVESPRAGEACGSRIIPACTTDNKHCEVRLHACELPASSTVYLLVHSSVGTWKAKYSVVNVTPSKLALGGEAIHASLSDRSAAAYYMVDASPGELRAGESVQFVVDGVCGNVTTSVFRGSLAGGQCQRASASITRCESLRGVAYGEYYVQVLATARAFPEYGNEPIRYSIRAVVVAGEALHTVTLTSGQLEVVLDASTVYVYGIDSLASYSAATKVTFSLPDDYDWKNTNKTSDAGVLMASNAIAGVCDDGYVNGCTPAPGEQSCTFHTGDCTTGQMIYLSFAVTPTTPPGSWILVEQASPFVREIDATHMHDSSDSSLRQRGIVSNQESVAGAPRGTVPSVEHYRVMLDPESIANSDYLFTATVKVLSEVGDVTLYMARSYPPSDGAGCFEEFCTTAVSGDEGIRSCSLREPCALQLSPEIWLTVEQATTTEASVEYELIISLNANAMTLVRDEPVCSTLALTEREFFLVNTESITGGTANQVVTVRVFGIDEDEGVEVYVSRFAPFPTPECYEWHVSCSASDVECAIDVRCADQSYNLTVLVVGAPQKQKGETSYYIAWSAEPEVSEPLMLNAVSTIGEHYHMVLPELADDELFGVEFNTHYDVKLLYSSTGPPSEELGCWERDCSDGCLLACDYEAGKTVYFTVVNDAERHLFSLEPVIQKLNLTPLVSGVPMLGRTDGKHYQTYSFSIDPTKLRFTRAGVYFYAIQGGSISAWITQDRIGDMTCGISGESNSAFELTFGFCDLPQQPVTLYVTVVPLAIDVGCGGVTYTLVQLTENISDPMVLSSGAAVEALVHPGQSDWYSFTVGEDVDSSAVLDIVLVGATESLVRGTLYAPTTSATCLCQSLLVEDHYFLSACCTVPGEYLLNVQHLRRVPDAPITVYSLVITLETPVVLTPNEAVDFTTAPNSLVTRTYLKVEGATSDKSFALQVSTDSTPVKIEIRQACFPVPLMRYTCYTGSCVLPFSRANLRPFDDADFLIVLTNTPGTSSPATASFAYTVGFDQNCIVYQGNFCNSIDTFVWRFGQPANVERGAKVAFEQMYQQLFCRSDCHCRPSTAACNETLARLACSTVMPACDSAGYLATPCRSLCHQVEKACSVDLSQLMPQYSCQHNWYSDDATTCDDEPIEPTPTPTPTPVPPHTTTEDTTEPPEDKGNNDIWWILLGVLGGLVLVCLLVTIAAGVFIYLKKQKSYDEYTLVATASGDGGVDDAHYADDIQE